MDGSDGQGRTSTGIPGVNRLRWQCRRGMLELDLLLEAFLDAGYEGLDEPDKKAFVDLLGQPDQLLLDWLIGHARPEDGEVGRLVDIVRARVAQG